MLFRVWNLGPIREAELDLSKDLIVLTGPNNTGKTYLTWAVYGLVPPLAVLMQKPPGTVQRIVDAVLAAHAAGDPVTNFSIAPEVFLDDVIADLLRRLPDEFAAPAERFRETKAELRPGDLKFDETQKSPLVLGEYQFSGTFEEGHFRLTASRIKEGSAKGVGAAELKPETLRQALSILFWFYLAGSFFETNQAAFPVERMAINLFARELAANRTQLVDQLLESAGKRQELLHRHAGRYPRAIRDALQIALKLDNEALSPFGDLADEIERDVLGGRMSKTEFDELQFTPALTDVKPIGLHQSASVIKSLASLVWHLRYQAVSGQRLIIDEPELNLHPDNQRRVARVLAKAVNRGLKIMMSTHSDYLVRELNNLIMLSQDTDAARGLVQEMGIDPLSTIRPDRLGVYLVHDGECRPVPVRETGFEVKTIDEEIHRLNRDSQTIYSRLFCE